MTAPKRFRDPPHPKPILDRRSFEKDLRASGIVLKDGQLDSFYQSLHRCGYPPLQEFLDEHLLRDRSRDEHCNDENGSDAAISPSPGGSGGIRTKNPISSRRSKRSNDHARLPKSFTTYLQSNTSSYSTLTSQVQTSQTSSNGTTTKLAVRLHDGHVVESVLMRHEGRVTICVSSQVGCAMGCTFCATGTMGIRGNLSAGEILEQMVHGSRILAAEAEVVASEYASPTSESASPVAGDHEQELQQRRQPTSKNSNGKRLDLIRNVVFMGMGEPLNNYANVLTACRAMIDRRLWNLAHNRVTVSTVGVVSRMRDLTRELPEVNLALSLHAPNQEMREKIVPAAKGTPVELLIEALDGHMMELERRKRTKGGDSGDNPQESDAGAGAKKADVFDFEERRMASKKKRAMIEYVMLEGDTSTVAAAHQLGKLCANRHLVVNLIPYNKTNVKDKLSCPTEERMQEFRQIVSSYGSFCTIRRTMGADIAGACGQLVVEEEEKKNKAGVMRGQVDIEDGPWEGKSAKAASDIDFSARQFNRRKKHSEEGRSVLDDVKADRWVRRLALGTAIAAACFVVSSALLVVQRRRK